MGGKKSLTLPSINMKTVFIAILSAMLVTVSCKRKVLLECGIPKIWAQELITNAQDTAPGDWPWHAAIFRRKGHSTDYVCGGTVISEEFIVTAAHCVMNAANGFQLAPNRIFVRLGIHDLHVINPEFIQQHEVGKIFKFANFTRFVDDIALLKLSTIIRFTDYVQPACVNLEPNITGEYGTVVGWGLTENDETSPILKKADIPVIDPVACLKTDRVLFGRTLDDGLFCAGYTNGTGVCNGDSGGGLFFRRANSWFLGGIVSFSQIRSDGYKNCYMKGYGAFTKVHHYVPWISEIMGMSFQRNNAVQVCKAVEPNQTSLSSKLLPRHCGVYIPNRIIGGVQAKVFEFPWMALLLENDKPYMCQGTLISKRYILTAAHCFGYSLPDKVHLGEHTIDQDVDCNDRDEDCAPPVREYDIECITTHPEFSWTTFADDVALVRLSEEVRCEDHIQPICLPHTSGLRNYQPPRYIVTGWGDDTDRLYRKISNILFKVTNLLAPHAECYQYRPNNITEKQLCVGPMGFGGPCIGEGGAPLGYGAKLYGMRFVQFGIDSIGELCGSGPKFYSNVSYYMDWIIANMKP